MRSPLVLAVAFAVVLSSSGGAALEDGEAESAEAVARAWLDQYRGVDSLEAYELRVGDTSLEFALARKWSPDGARVFVDVRSPLALRKIALLFRQSGDGGSMDGWIYVPTGPTARLPYRLPPAAAEIRIPGTQISIPSSLFFSVLAGEIEHRRLADMELDGESCYVVETRGADVSPDEWTELVLSKRTGVALRTTVYKRGAAALIVRAPMRRLREDLDRWRPGLLQIENPRNGATAELILRNLMLEPDLPDRLFTKHNLRIQRFPGF